MKRALFKMMGNHFVGESTTQREHWVVDVDVQVWNTDPRPNWQFNFQTLDTVHADTLEATRGTPLSQASTGPKITRQTPRQFRGGPCRRASPGANKPWSEGDLTPADRKLGELPVWRAAREAAIRAT